MTALILELANSTVGASVETTTVCDIWPTCNAKFSTCCSPTVSVMPVCNSVENPWAEALIS
jgi:hypothetical protein